MTMTTIMNITITTMSIITMIMMKNVDVDTITTMTTNIITMITTKNVDADTITIMTMNIIIMTMTKNADVDADMTTIMIITTIMQMKYLQAGVKKHLRNIIKKNWKQFYRNYPKMTAMA